ncbi:neuraminidase-like domain-containing protein [Chitinophagaceae bacterium MMS25-I14]
MNVVNAPINLGQQGDQVNSLQQALLWFIQNNFLQISDPELLNIFYDEMTKSFYGTATTKLTVMLGQTFGFDGSQGIDPNAAAIINSRIPLSQPDLRKLTGLVTNSNGKPMGNIRIDASAISLRDTFFLGETFTAADGTFEMDYQLPGGTVSPPESASPPGGFTTGVQVTAFPDTTDPVISPVYFNSNNTIYVELTIPVDADATINDEFTLLRDRIMSVAGDQFYSLTSSDTTFIAGGSGENETMVRMFLLSMEYANRISVQPAIFYGVMRKTTIQSLEAICNTDKLQLIDAISYAVAVNIIPHYDSNTVANSVGIIKSMASNIILSDAGKAPEDSRSYKILSYVLSDVQIETFLQHYYNADTTNPGFWDEAEIAATVPGISTAAAANLKLALTYALISGSNPGIVRHLLTQPAESSAGKDIAYWSAQIQASMAQDFVFPDYVTGDTTADKVADYANTLKNNFDGAFPVTAIHQSIVSDTQTSFVALKQGISSFTTANPSFSLLHTPVADLQAADSSFDFSVVADRDAFISEVSAVQRLSIVTPSYPAMSALQSAGLSSAQAITQMPQQQFVQNYSQVLGSASNALLTYNNAVTTNLITQAVAVGTYQWINQYIPSIYTTPPDANPDWRSLFGNVDFCTCSDCMSVFSPAAYFVDSLELLRKNNLPAYNWLKAKRPDLWDLKLTCKNTNNALPYIDLVNEILEDMMNAAGKPAAAAPSPLYPIQAHDTTLDSRTLRAVPQYINTVGIPLVPSPYDTLKGAVYPWNVPYNYYSEQTREFLGLIDLKPYQVAQTFTSVTDAYTLNDVNLACAYLGITDAEHAIIIDNNTSNVHSYYGYGAAVTLLPVTSLTYAGLLNAVDIFLQKSGLTFTDLLELLDCYYINPLNTLTTPVSRHLSIKPLGGTACDTSKMTIDGLTLTDLLSIHRFIRLQRHTGWSKYELDRAFKALGIAAGTAITDGVITAIAQIKRLTEILSCSVDDILPFWGDIAYMPYSTYGGDNPELQPTQYENFFRNQAVVPNFDNITGYPFVADFTSWQNTMATANAAITKNQLDYVLAAFRTSEQDFDYIFSFFKQDANLSTYFSKDSNGNFIFIYDNIRKLLRECTFARLMRLEIKDWCLFRSWLKGLSVSVDPFVYSGSAQVSAAITFIEKVKSLRNSPFSTDDLNYIFSDRFSDDTDIDSKQTALFTRYKELRTLLVKLNTPVGAVIDTKALLTKLELVMDDTDAAFAVNYIGNHTQPDNTPVTTVSADDRSRLEALLPGELTANQAHEIAFQLTNLVPSGYTPSGTYLGTAADRLTLINSVFTRAILKGQVRHYLSTTCQVDLAVSEILLDKWITTGTADGYDVLLNENYISSITDPVVPGSAPQPYAKDALVVLERFTKATAIIKNGALSATDVDFFLQKRAVLSIPDIANLPSGNVWGISPASATVSSSSWTNLIDWLYVKDAMTPSPTGLVIMLQTVLDSGVSTPGGTGGIKDIWFNAFMQAVQVSADDLTSLAGNSTTATPPVLPAPSDILRLDFASANPPYLQPETYKRIFACLDMRAVLEINMESCKNIAGTALHPQAQADADLVVQAVKARYDNNEWLDQSQPINDRLRTGRRDAMIAYLLANPPQAYAQQWFTVSDIFETLLIDTEMMPIVQTSRIKQAISTVQLFIDRCVLQEEIPNGTTTAIQLTTDTISQWNLWRKWYRIWEANRQVFVYPENWIEPDLRDDKSPFFEELEKYLKQNDITADTMEDAYRTYLERLDEVAHLDVVAYHAEDIKDSNNNIIDSIVHVWGRTRSNPHIYYYRSRTGGIWSAWEKMDVQVDGETFAGVKWRGRLRLYWLSFTEQAVKQPGKIVVNEEQDPAHKYWKIDLNWTELKNGRWQPKQVGKESIQTDTYNAWTTDTFKYYYGGQHGTDVNAIWTLPYTLDTFDDSFEALKNGMMLHADINGDGDLQVWLQGAIRYIKMDAVTTALNSRTDKKMSFGDLKQQLINKTGDSNAASDSNITASLYSNGTQLSITQLRNLQSAYYISNQFWRDRIGEVIADMFSDGDYTGQVNSLYNDAINNNTILYRSFRGPYFVIKHNKVHVSTTWPYTFFSDLYENLGYIGDNSQYDLGPDNANGYNHIINRVLSANSLTTVPLLAKSPQYGVLPSHHQYVKYLVFDRMIPQGINAGYIPFPKFFYKDYQNSFFVEKISVPVSLVLTQSTTSSAATSQLTGISIGSAGTGIVSGTSSAAFLVTTNGSASQPQAFTISNPGSSTPIAQTPHLTTTANFYRFYPFYHYRTNELADQLDRYGLDGLFDWDFILSKTTSDEMNFSGNYLPTSNVMHYLPANQTSTDPQKNAYPATSLDFRYDSPNAIYNWELFFHIPMMIANKLMQDQKFTEAMQWFHYVFNPTNISGGSHGSGAARFWQFHPFFLESGHVPTVDQIMSDPSLPAAVQQWANNPFKPHLVARTRVSAYMKNVLMKYLDNLIAWGDQLFRRDTLEEINEATLLYVLAAQLLGKEPVKMPAFAASSPKSYNDFANSPSSINAFSNAQVAVETMLAPTGVSQAYSSTGSTALQMYYFCIPPNDKLLSYWGVVADRLFKIRNSENIDGVERQLALFEPPIDPALLVRAAASGVSLSDAVNELFAPLPQYRFNIMVQKATELAQEIKSLGSSLLSAIEKKDAEHISLLRSSNELSVLEAAKEVRLMQIQEAQAQIAGLQEQQNMVTIRRDYFQNLINTGLNVYEQSQLDSLQKSIPLKISAQVAHALSGVMHVIPNFKVGSPFSMGITFGGDNVGNLVKAGATALDVLSAVNDIHGSMAATKAGHARRTEDWAQQLKMANAELKQIDKQLIAAEIREAIAEKELANHNLQYQNAQNLDQAMHDKYSNEDLYDWMISQISLTYFQSYKLAFDVAKRAERCFAFEIGDEPTTPFIQFGYWDSLKKGLLAGEALLYDIKRMDAAFLDQNKRLHEMTKHISLAALDATALLQLKSGARVQIKLPEWLFDMDYPGHYMRRIKSVSLSIPCVAGPYTTISAKLTLLDSKYRKNALLLSGSTDADKYKETATDPRFVYTFGGSDSIATSAAQNDSGMFEMNFRDERYLPFEGAGAVSTWALELPSKYASFDINSISDVIFHVHYTAKYDGGLAAGANAEIVEKINDVTSGALIPRVFNLKQEFVSEWAAYEDAVNGGNTNAVLSLPITIDMFPFFCKGKTVTVTNTSAAANNILFKASRVGNTSANNTLTLAASSSPMVLTFGTAGVQSVPDFTSNKIAATISSTSTYQLNLKITGIAPGNIESLWFALIYKIN